MHQNTSSTHFTDYTHRSCAPCMNPRKIVATVLKGSACIAAQQMLNTYADINNKINSQFANVTICTIFRGTKFFVRMRTLADQL